MPDPIEYLDEVIDGDFSTDQRTFITRIFSDYLSTHYQPNRTDYRIAAERLFKFLAVIDELMSQSRKPDRTWREISLAIGLPSARSMQLTMAKVGDQYDLTKMAISKSVNKLICKAQQSRLNDIRTVTCPGCHKTFSPVRSTAKYCSKKCQMRVSRRIQKESECCR